MYGFLSYTGITRRNTVFIFFRNLEYVRVSVLYRDNQAEYGIHILVTASQEYMYTYSLRRSRMQPC